MAAQIPNVQLSPGKRNHFFFRDCLNALLKENRLNLKIRIEHAALYGLERKPRLAGRNRNSQVRECPRLERFRTTAQNQLTALVENAANQLRGCGERFKKKLAGIGNRWKASRGGIQLLNCLGEVLG